MNIPLELCNDYTFSFTELLPKNNSLTIHQRNLKKLITGIFKVKTGVASEVMKDIFEISNTPYNLRNNLNIFSNNIRTVSYSSETASYIGSKICKNSKL